MNAVVAESVVEFDRRDGLGASDAAAAVGQSKWRTPLQLWREKVGEASNEELFAARLPLLMGKALEPLVLDLFTQKTGLSAAAAHQKRVHDPANPWRWVTLDALAEDGRPVEAKSAAQAGAAEWGDQNEDDAVPMIYYLQCQHSMACNPEWDYVWMPLLVLNRQFRVYRVRRDNDVIALLTPKEQDFMGYVARREPPPPVDLEDVSFLYPTDRGTTLVAQGELQVQVSQLAAAKAARKVAEKIEADLVFQVKQAMGEHAILTDPMGKVLCTWKQNKPSLKFNKDKFRAAHPAIYQQFEESVAGNRPLLVK